ncbi:MAG TPA: undecaprenyl-diphosphatase UppP, partial [Anaerolineae bacterium]
IILGIIQGLTEYIPVSSTAHLILVPWLFGWQYDTNAKFVFDILIQWGTLLGVAVYFWHDIVAIVREVINGLIQRKPFGTPNARLGWLVVIATIPAIIAGLLFKSKVEALYNSYLLIAILIVAAGGLLIVAERFGQRLRALDSMKWLDALIIGVWQVLALLPGVSRSSATMTGGMLRNFNRTDAARFSFLMSIPALLGAGVIAIKDLLEAKDLLSQLAAPLAVGFISAAMSGYLVVRWLLNYLRSRTLNAFAIYRVVFGAICIIVALTRT